MAESVIKQEYFVVESGTSGNWIYRKFSDGWAELTYYEQKTRSATSTNFAADLPFALTNSRVSTCAGSTANTNAYASYANIGASLDCWVIASQGTYVWLHAIVIGKWR